MRNRISNNSKNSIKISIKIMFIFRKIITFFCSFDVIQARTKQKNKLKKTSRKKKFLLCLIEFYWIFIELISVIFLGDCCWLVGEWSSVQRPGVRIIPIKCHKNSTVHLNEEEALFNEFFLYIWCAGSFFAGTNYQTIKLLNN